MALLPEEGFASGVDHLGDAVLASTLNPRIERRLLAGAVALAARPLRRPRWGAGRSSSARRSAARRFSISIVSGPPKRRLASRPVSASGEKLARSSQEDADLVLPVDVVEREGDEAERLGRPRRRAAAPISPCAVSRSAGSPRKRLASRDRPFDIG